MTSTTTANSACSRKICCIDSPRLSKNGTTTGMITRKTWKKPNASVLLMFRLNRSLN